jgi:hypothetical protein
LLLLIREGKIDQKKTAAAVGATFTRRATHEMPRAVDAPPAEWEGVFDALAKECGIAMKMGEGFAVVRDFTRTLEMQRAR